MCRESESREEKNLPRTAPWLKEAEMINPESVILPGSWHFFNSSEEVSILKDMLGNLKGPNFTMPVSENSNWMAEDSLGSFVEELIRRWEFAYNDTLLFLLSMKAPRRVDSKGSLSKNPFRDNSYVSVALQDLLLGDSGCKKETSLFLFSNRKIWWITCGSKRRRICPLELVVTYIVRMLWMTFVGLMSLGTEHFERHQ